MHQLPLNIKSLDEIINENPEIKKFSKYYNTIDFIPLKFVIFSQPQSHLDHTVYGIWVLVKANVINKVTPKIKQDFLVFDRVANKYIYYSGLGLSDLYSEHQSITNFCNKFGKHLNGTWGQYGTYLSEKGTPITTDHHYDDQYAKNLPSEEWIRRLIDDKIKLYEK